MNSATPRGVEEPSGLSVRMLASPQRQRPPSRADERYRNHRMATDSKVIWRNHRWREGRELYDGRPRSHLGTKRGDKPQERYRGPRTTPYRRQSICTEFKSLVKEVVTSARRCLPSGQRRRVTALSSASLRHRSSKCVRRRLCYRRVTNRTVRGRGHSRVTLVGDSLPRSTAGLRFLRHTPPSGQRRCLPSGQHRLPKVCTQRPCRRCPVR